MRYQTSILVVYALLMAGTSAWGDADVIPEGVAAQDDAMLGEAAMTDAQLDEMRGRQTVFNTNEVDGQLYNNEAISNVTGSNFVSDGSFANMSGFSTVIQNSGNNVLIQNATVLNLQFQ